MLTTDFDFLSFVRHELRPNESVQSFTERSGLTAAIVNSEDLTRHDISMILRSREETKKRLEEELKSGT